MDYFSKNVYVTKGGKTFEEIHMFFLFKRQSQFYMQFLLFPTIVVVGPILTTFWIPPARPDRTAVGKYGTTVMLLS